MFGIFQNSTIATVAVSACLAVGIGSAIAVTASEEESFAAGQSQQQVETLPKTTQPATGNDKPPPERTTTAIETTRAELNSLVESNTASEPSTKIKADPELIESTANETANAKSQASTTQTQTVSTQPQISNPASTTVPRLTTTSTINVPVSAPTVEQRIFALVNEYRANPNGRLKRERALPAECPSTASLPPLSLNQNVSTTLARDWSQQMAANNIMSHRPTSEQRNILESLSINFITWGENVAWQSGYRNSQLGDQLVAQVFFEGWRDSDSHLCNIMNPAYTHTGIGHFYDEATGKDWATQNFYG